MEGELLLQQLIELIGLPAGYVGKELDHLVAANNLNRDSLTLDDLRPILADLVQDVLLDTKKSL